MGTFGMTCHNNNHPGIEIISQNLAQFRFFDYFFLVGIVQFQFGYHVGPCASEHLKRKCNIFRFKCPAILVKKMAQNPNNISIISSHFDQTHGSGKPPKKSLGVLAFSSVARSPEELDTLVQPWRHPCDWHVSARVKGCRVVFWGIVIPHGHREPLYWGKNDPYSWVYKPYYSVDYHLLLHGNETLGV